MTMDVFTQDLREAIAAIIATANASRSAFGVPLVPAAYVMLDVEEPAEAWLTRGAA